MKRFIPVLLSVCLLVGTLAVPASAAGTEASFIDLLDYGTINEAGSQFITLNASKQEFWYKLPNYGAPYYVDILFSATGSVPTSIQVKVTQTYNLTLVPIGNNLYRAFGNVASSNNILTIITDVSGTCWLQMLSFKVSLIKSDIKYITGKMDIDNATSYSDTINYNSADTINHRSWNGSVVNGDNEVWFQASTPYWKQFDFLEFQFLFYLEGISSISAFCGNNILPIETSVVLNNSHEDEFFYVTVRVDLRSLNRTITSVPYVRIEGTESYTGSNMAGVQSMAGLIEYEDSFLTYWFTKITQGISGILGALSDNSGSDDLQNDVDNAGSELDNIGDIMDSVTRPDIGGVDTDITDEIGSDVDPSFITSFFRSDYVASIFSIVAVLATAGYVLYGKR